MKRAKARKKFFAIFSKAKSKWRRIKGRFYREKKLLISQSIKETEFNFIVLDAKFVFLLDVKKDG